MSDHNHEGLYHSVEEVVQNLAAQEGRVVPPYTELDIELTHKLQVDKYHYVVGGRSLGKQKIQEHLQKLYGGEIMTVKFEQPEPERIQIGYSEDTHNLHIFAPMDSTIVEEKDGEVQGVQVIIPFDQMRKFILNYLKAREIERLESMDEDTYEDYLTGLWPNS